jgi:hypothetical protein
MTMRARQLAAVWWAAVAGPLLWATVTQIGQILPYDDCARGNHWTAIIALATAALALMSGGICWTNRSLDRTSRFACGVGSLLALVVAFAMLLQSTAGFMLSGCER